MVLRKLQEEYPDTAIDELLCWAHQCQKFLAGVARCQQLSKKLLADIPQHWREDLATKSIRQVNERELANVLFANRGDQEGWNLVGILRNCPC